MNNARLSDNVFDKAIRRTAMYLTAKLPAAEKQIYFGLIVLILKQMVRQAHHLTTLSEVERQITMTKIHNLKQLFQDIF